MKTYKYNVGDKQVSLTLNAAGQIVSTEGLSPSEALPQRGSGVGASYAAAICLALAEDAATVVHDDETASSVTIKHAPTPWNNPQRQFNTLHKEIKA